MKRTFIISCEHAGNQVPGKCRHLFPEEVLASHRGWDPGAKQLAKFLADTFNSPFFFCDISRLIIETNRSLHHPQLYSEFTQTLPEAEKQELLRQIYFPYREAVEESIREAQSPVIHLSIHTFTPVLNDVTREVDVGLLFDPARTLETTWCTALLKNLSALINPLQVRFNEPYQGIDDGFTTYLRTKFPDEEYAGIEIEINQKHIGKHEAFEITNALAEIIKHEQP